ncbi:MAG: hypothetical protein IKL01_00560 [Mailhella sp.]|nr:hypothetical protein [Mailhella sp.]
MRNPWLDLSYDGPEYVLSSDRDAVLAYNNKKTEDEKKFHLELPPEPYHGNPDAPVLLLAKCPSYRDNDAPFMLDNKDFRKAMRATLLHEPQEFPFYYLAPEFSKSPGAEYWKKGLAELSRFSWRHLANKLFVLNYYPYKCVFPTSFPKSSSTPYTGHLLKNAIKRNALIIVYSGKKEWEKLAPLQDYKNAIYPNAQRQLSITYKNFPKDFYRILDALR